MGPEKELIQCSVCEDFFSRNEAYRCPRCKKSPLCKKHRLPGNKECISCTIELKLYEMRSLHGQEKNIHHFLRFIQFIFLVCSVFFVSLKIGLLDEIDFLKNNIFTDNVLPIGMGSIIFYVLFYIILLNQRQRIAALQSEIDTIGFRKL